jgi:parallel beta-helix repeat protein
MSRAAIQFFLLLFLCLAPLPLQGAVIYVSPDGSDDNSGDLSQPLKTISRAGDMARPGDSVIIQPGVYRETLGLTCSGTPGRAIVFQAKEPGTAIITGADVLTIWALVGDHPGEFVCDWPHDFIIDHTADGAPVRFHGAPAPVGCAEQILWEGHPLKQVMQFESVVPGTFFVDWENHSLTIALPGGVDPRAGEVEGCVRSDLFGPKNSFDKLADSEWITVRGLTFRDAGNFAQRGGVVLGSHWRAENCVVENDNAGGMSLAGNDIVVQKCTAQFNGFCGISGEGNNDTLQDCVVCGNNRKGFPPDWEGGGGKFCRTDHLKVIHHTSYDNTGPGLWLDIDNTNYSITDSVFYGNRGLDADWEGIGIFIEISGGPGVIQRNVCYSNTGAGILLAESQNIKVDGNVLVDNGNGVELRAMAGRDNHNLDHLAIQHNQFKASRKAAISTSLGDWSADSPAARAIDIDENLYDLQGGKPLWSWADSPLAGLADVRSLLKLETHGDTEDLEFQHRLENAKSISDADRPTILNVLKNAAVGDEVALPAIGRTKAFGEGNYAIFDFDGNWAVVHVEGDEAKTRFEEVVSESPVIQAVGVRGKVLALPPNGKVSFLGIK